MPNYRARYKNPGNQTGSPKSGEPVFIAIAKIRKPHGYHGEVALDSLLSSQLPFNVGSTVWLGEDHFPAVVKSIRIHGKGWLVSFLGMEKEIQDLRFRNTLIFLPTTLIPPRISGIKYYRHEIIGFSVIDETSCDIGIVVDVLATGANDVYVIKSYKNNKEILLPVIDEVILDIDIENHILIVRLQDWE